MILHVKAKQGPPFLESIGPRRLPTLKLTWDNVAINKMHTCMHWASEILYNSPQLPFDLRQHSKSKRNLCK